MSSRSTETGDSYIRRVDAGRPRRRRPLGELISTLRTNESCERPDSRRRHGGRQGARSRGRESARPMAKSGRVRRRRPPRVGRSGAGQRRRIRRGGRRSSRGNRVDRPVSSRRLRASRGSVGAGDAGRSALLGVAVGFGLGVELVQTAVPWRAFAWRDAAVNALGASVGALVVGVRSDSIRDDRRRTE